MLRAVIVLLVGYVVLFFPLMLATYPALWVSETVTGMESHGYMGWHVQLSVIVYVAFCCYNGAFVRYLIERVKGLQEMVRSAK